MDETNLTPATNNVNEIILHGQLEDLRERLDNFNINVNKPPKPKEIAKHKHYGFDYIPIDALQKKADKYFLGLWKWEILWEPRLVINEIQVAGRFHYLHPTAGIWLFRDGVGVAQVRFESKKDWTKIENKIQNTLQMDIPHAEAEAMKSAMAKIGDAFGRNLRRELKTEYERLTKPKKALAPEFEALKKETEIIIGEFQDPKEMFRKKDLIFKNIKGKLPDDHYNDLLEQFRKHYQKIKGAKNG